MSFSQFKVPVSLKRLVFRGKNQDGPTYWQSFRETIGQALRETGQALDRAGLRLESFTLLPNKYVGADPPCIYEDSLSRHRQQMPLLHCGKPVVSKDVAFLAPCATLIGNVRVQAGASIWYGAILRGDTCLNASSLRKTDEELLAQLELENDRIASGRSEIRGDPLLFDDDNNNSAENPSTLKSETTLSSSSPNDNYQTEGGGIYIGEDTNLQDCVVVTARHGNTVLGRGVTVGHLAQIHSATVDDFALIGMGSILGEGVHVETEALVAAGAVVTAGTRVGAGELWVGQPARKIRTLTAEQRAKLHYQSDEYVKVALTQQHVSELGGCLPPDLSLLDAVKYNMENDRLNEETMESRVLRTNRWSKTIYRQYVLPPTPPEAVNASPLLDEGATNTTITKFTAEETTRQLSGTAEERNRGGYSGEKEANKQQHQNQPPPPIVEPETASTNTTTTTTTTTKESSR